MNPYRAMEVIPPEPTKPGRPLYKTLYLKLLIKLKGTWKNRFVRCPNCSYYEGRGDGMHYNSSMFFHQLECHVLKLHAEKAVKEYRKANAK